MLIVTGRSTDEDLTTTGALKARIFGATATSTNDDVMLSAMIRAASRWAQSYVGYPLTAQSYRETLPAYGTRTLRVDRTPIRGIRALYESTDTGDVAALESTSYRVESEEAGFITRDEGWEWTAPSEFELESRPLPGQEQRPWMADYVAGYTYGGMDTGSTNWVDGGTTSTGRTLPEDIEEAILLRSRLLYEQSALGGEVESEKLGDLSVNYRSGATDRPGGAPSVDPSELLLEPYRRLV